MVELTFDQPKIAAQPLTEASIYENGHYSETVKGGTLAQHVKSIVDEAMAGKCRSELHNDGDIVEYEVRGEFDDVDGDAQDADALVECRVQEDDRIVPIDGNVSCSTTDSSLYASVNVVRESAGIGR